MNIISYNDNIFGSIPAIRFINSTNTETELLAVTVSNGCSVVVYKVESQEVVEKRSGSSLREMVELINLVTAHLEDNDRDSVRNYLGAVVFLGHLWEATCHYHDLWREIEADSKELDLFVKYYRAIDEELYLDTFKYEELSKLASGDKRSSKDNLFAANIAVRDQPVGGSVIVDSDCVLFKLNKKSEPLSLKFNINVHKNLHSELLLLSKYFILALESFSGAVLPQTPTSSSTFRDSYLKNLPLSSRYLQLSSLDVKDMRTLMQYISSHSNKIKVFGARNNNTSSSPLKPSSLFT